MTARKKLWAVREVGTGILVGLFRAEDVYDLWDAVDNRCSPTGFEYARVTMSAAWNDGHKVSRWHDDMAWEPFDVDLHWHGR